MFPFPVCQRADTVSVGSVPRSVPLGTPRKPLQGLDVPQFHDFRRIGGKNTEKTIRAHPGEKGPRTFAPQARCAPRVERVGYGSAVGGEPARKARVAPRVRSGAEGARWGMERGSEGGKTSVFLRIPGDFRADLFRGRNKRCRHISPQQRTEEAKNRFVRQVWQFIRIGSFERGRGSVCGHAFLS